MEVGKTQTTTRGKIIKLRERNEQQKKEYKVSKIEERETIQGKILTSKREKVANFFLKVSNHRA